MPLIDQRDYPDVFAKFPRQRRSAGPRPFEGGEWRNISGTNECTLYRDSGPESYSFTKFDPVESVCRKRADAVLAHANAILANIPDSGELHVLDGWWFHETDLKEGDVVKVFIDSCFAIKPEAA